MNRDSAEERPVGSRVLSRGILIQLDAQPRALREYQIHRDSVDTGIVGPTTFPLIRKDANTSFMVTPVSWTVLVYMAAERWLDDEAFMDIKVFAIAIGNALLLH